MDAWLLPQLSTFLCSAIASMGCSASLTLPLLLEKPAPEQDWRPPTVLSQCDASISPAEGHQLEARLQSFLNPAGSQSAGGVSAKPGSQSFGYTVLDEFSKPRFRVEGTRVFQAGQLPAVNLQTDERKLLSVLCNTRLYFARYVEVDPTVLRQGVLGTQGITLAQVLETLDFSIAILREDIQQGRPTRLRNPQFINQHFKVMRWSAYNPKNRNQSSLRLTKYAVFAHPGSRVKTATYNTPLYALVDRSGKDQFYLQYTKQAVLSGIYEPGGREYGKAKPLVYLTRNGLEDALMQGTIQIKFPDGTVSYFNVDKNNGIAYVRGLAPRQQRRYWYFQQVNSIKGYGYRAEAKIPIEPGVTFAGDTLNIGLGRLVVLDYGSGNRRRLKLGAIADTGGAFVPNLYQLDLLAGVFQTRGEFNRYIAQLPQYVRAYILIKK